jgi:hypothetical protein
MRSNVVPRLRQTQRAESRMENEIVHPAQLDTTRSPANPRGAPHCAVVPCTSVHPLCIMRPSACDQCAAVHLHSPCGTFPPFLSPPLYVLRPNVRAACYFSSLPCFSSLLCFVRRSLASRRSLALFVAPLLYSSPLLARFLLCVHLVYVPA